MLISSLRGKGRLTRTLIFVNPYNIQEIAPVLDNSLNQKNFTIYRRKYMHNLKVCVNATNFEGCKGIELVSQNIFLVTNLDQVLIFDSETFLKCGNI